MANVSLKEVYKYYDKNETPSVADFNLEIEDKEFIVFVGPSGCGKSTTLRMIAGLEEISYGEVRIDDRVVNEVEPKDRDIAMVFQNYALYPHMTVFDNIAFGLKMKKTPDFLRDSSKSLTVGMNFLQKMFAKVPLEQRDEQGNVVLDEQGKPLYVVKTDKKGNPVVGKDGKPEYVMRPMTADEKYGPAILDEQGNLQYVHKTYTQSVLNSEMVYQEKLDEQGNIVHDEQGNVVYEAELNHDGTVKMSNGKPVYKLRHYTEAEKAELLGKNRVNPKTGEYIYKMRHYYKEEIREKVLEAAAILDIVPYLERKPKALSGGQRQRVAIGRAIVRKPKVFLMDEPLSNLDAKLRNQMRAEILLLRRRINTTFIYVTHDQTEAMTLGDRIVIMRDGFIQQIGTPTDLFDHPENLFVAGFIGTPQMNFFKAKLVDEGDYVVDLLGKKFPVEAKINKYLQENKVGDKEIVLGVRPEHITCLRSGETPKKGTQYLDAKVEVSEMMGSELYVHATVDNQKVIVRLPMLGLSQEDRWNIHQCGNLQLTFIPDVMNLFDSETERNLIPIDVAKSR